MEKKERRQIYYKAVMLVTISVLITFIVTTIGVYSYVTKNSESKYITIPQMSSSSSDIGKTLEKFKSMLEKYYLGEIDEEKLNEGAIKGYISALDDPYTEYFTEEEMEEFMQDTSGEYVGIGIYMTRNTEKNVIQVITPVKDSPAAKAGILPGDIIYKVDGEEYSGDQMSVAANKIKGNAGEEVNLEILRDGEIKKITIMREVIKLYPVESEMLESNIGYISFSTFDEGCAEEFKTKYNELKNQGATSLIIDLRNNGGGLVDEAIDIAEFLVEKDKTLLITVDKNGNEEVTKSEETPIVDVPVIVLVNENTASASEILSGALKDHGKAQIVGTKTYGKGVIQQLISLSDGSGIKITTSEYFTPNRTKINKVGIEPDVTCELPEDVENVIYVEREQDTQLKKAIELLK